MAAKVRWAASSDELLSCESFPTVLSALRRAASAPDLVNLASGEDWLEEHELGWGHAGRVLRARHRESGELAAKKVAEGQAEGLLREAQILQQCQHPNILSLHGLCRDGFSVSLLLELMDRGSLHDLLRQKGPMPNGCLIHVTKELIQALDYLHGTVGILHRDLKPSNILANAQGEIKLADFGESGDGTAQLKSAVGSALYMSPERVQGEAYSTPADIWSLGCTIIELATGQTAFDPQQSVIELWESIVMDPSPRLANSSLSSLVDGCLEKDPQRRPTAKQLLSDPIFSQDLRAEFLAWLA